jgi:hypothetical protein
MDHLKGDQSCQLEPFSRLLQPSSLALDALLPFQPTLSHIAEGVALASTTPAFTAAAFTTVAFIVVLPYAVEWRWASELLRPVPPPTAHMALIAAAIIPIRPATRTEPGPLSGPGALGNSVALHVTN